MVGSIADQTAGGNQLAPIVNRGQCVAGRQPNQLIASANKEQVGDDKQCGDPLFDEAGESRIEVTLGAGSYDARLQAERAGCGLDIFRVGHGIGVVRVNEHADDAGCRHQLVQHLQSFRHEHIEQETDAREIPGPAG